MPKSTALFLASLVTLGCTHTTTVSRPEPLGPLATTDTKQPAKGAGDTWRIRLEPQAESGRVRVRIETATPTRWELPKPTSAVTPLHRDDRVLEYVVTPSPESPCPFEVTPNHALACGAALLPTPRIDVRRPIELRLGSDDGYYPHAASSYGLGTRQTATTSFRELARAGFLFGDVHHARFVADLGRDHAAWWGYFSFDPRWVAA